MLKARAIVEFKKLHPNKSGIQYLKICEEILSSDTTQITPFIYEQNNNAGQVSNLLEVRTKMVTEYLNKGKKQASLTNYFKMSQNN